MILCGLLLLFPARVKDFSECTAILNLSNYSHFSWKLFPTLFDFIPGLHLRYLIFLFWNWQRLILHRIRNKEVWSLSCYKSDEYADAGVMRLVSDRSARCSRPIYIPQMTVGSGCRVSASHRLILPDRICRYWHEVCLWYCYVLTKEVKLLKEEFKHPTTNTPLSSVSLTREKMMSSKSRPRASIGQIHIPWTQAVQAGLLNNRRWNALPLLDKKLNITL